MINQPNNSSTAHNPVGRFMVAVGAVIEHRPTGRILLTQRHHSLDWRPGEWEITYGRIDQHEDPQEGLRREVREEVGLTDVSISGVLRTWHMYRGPRTVENDLVGITYVATTDSNQITISSEHAAYRWVTPAEALELVTVEGIRRDIELFRDKQTALKPKIGRDVIGVGVGAVIINDQQEILLALRGPQAKNEVGKWEIPGGAVELGETLQQALVREIKEEIGVEIEVGPLLQVYNHILEQEGQHWVSPTFVCRITAGTPMVMEPGKCDQLAWFSLDKAKQLPLSSVTQGDIDHLEAKPELLTNSW